MKQLLFFKQKFQVLGLVALLFCGAWTAQAQYVVIKQGGNIIAPPNFPYYCMPVNNLGTQFQAEGVNLISNGVQGTIVQSSWGVLGGIDIVSGQTTSTVTVRPKTGINYATQYSKYAKGRLSVTCTVEYIFTYVVVDPCGIKPDTTITYPYRVNYSTQIEIRKEFADLTGNEIVGPECVKSGQTVTYSVAPWVSTYDLNVVGFDDYRWNIPAGVAQGNVLYYSADKSSVTFVVGNNFDGKTISVQLGACNIPTQVPLTLTLKAEPGVPTLPGNVNFSQGLCIPLGITSYPITISNTDPNATYIWGNLGGWLSDPLATTETVTSANNYTLTIYPKNDARVLWLKVISSCGTEQIYNLSVKRSFSSNNQIKTVSGSLCVEPNQFVPFMVTGVDNSVAITWSIVSGVGWYIFPGTENSPNAIIFTGTGNAVISVSTPGCPGITLTENFGITPKVPVINSGTPICLSSIPTTLTFSVLQNDPNAYGGYDWDYPSGWILVSSTSNKSSVTLTVNQGGAIKVRAIGCDTTSWSNPIEVGAIPSTPQFALFPVCVASGMPDNVTFSVNPVAGLTYQWDIPPAFGTISSASPDHSTIQVATLGNVGQYEIKVRAMSSCGNSAWVSDTITISAPYWLETIIAGNYRFVFVSPNNNLSNLFFSWYVNGVFYSAGYGYDYYDLIMLTPPNVASGTAYVIITTPAGCKYKAEITWPGKNNGASTPPKSSSTSVSDFDGERVLSDLNIAPNPASNLVTVTLPEMANSSIYIFSMDGKLTKRILGNSSNTEISVSDIPNGTYIIFAEQGGKRYSKQFIINK